MRAGLILLTVGVLCAQPAKKYPLEALHIEGNKRIPTERIVAASGLKLGALVRQGRLRRGARAVARIRGV